MNEEQLHKWLVNYEAGLEISSASQFSKRKREAMAYADDEFPEAQALRKSVGAFLRDGRQPESLEQLMGLRMVQGTSLIVRRFLEKNPEFRRQKRIELASPQPAPVKESAHGSHATVVEAYLSWLETHDEVPPDAVLAHFLDCTHGAAASARREAIKAGYVFEHQHGGNWKVVSRPSTKSAKVSKHSDVPTPEEVNRVVKFLLKEKRHA